VAGGGADAAEPDGAGADVELPAGACEGPVTCAADPHEQRSVAAATARAAAADCRTSDVTNAYGSASGQDSDGDRPSGPP